MSFIEKWTVCGGVTEVFVAWAAGGQRVRQLIRARGERKEENGKTEEM